MKNMLYCIYDKVAQEYGPVFEAKNQHVAARMCKNEFKNVSVLDDYVLYEVGEIDHETGVLGTYHKPFEVLELCDLADVFKEDVKEENVKNE